MSGRRAAPRTRPGAGGGRAPRPPALWPARLGVFLLRVYLGAVFLDAFHYKVFAAGVPLGEAFDLFVTYEYEPLVRQGIESPPEVLGVTWTWYADFLSAVMLPGAHFFGPAILVFEGLLGVALVLGAGVRLMGLLGAFLMAAFGLAKGLYFLTAARSTNWIFAVALLALALVAAGRVWGLDAWLASRLPRRLRWVA